MNKIRFRDKLRYWFDSRMAKGSLALIKILVIVTLIFVVLIGLLLYLSDYDSFGFSVFDSASAVINAWVPEAGGEEAVFSHLALKAAAGIFGLLLTSVLIGIVASSIEEKINDLKRGNSVVLESGHIVILGYAPGEYSLLKQIILAEGDDPACIVVAGDMERDEMEQDIRDNLEYGRNVRIICRKADITDPAALEKCSVARARSVIVSPADDAKTVKTLLALSSLIHPEDGTEVKIGAVVSNRKFKFPETEAKEHNITTLSTAAIIARIIAHTCTQEGLSSAFDEILSFEGSEFYTLSMPGADGLSFRELLLRSDGGMPVGLIGKGGITLNPDPERVIRKGERILFLAEDRDTPVLVPAPELPDLEDSGSASVPQEDNRIAIIGYNRMMPLILQELPEKMQKIVFVGLSEEEKSLVLPLVLNRPGFTTGFCGEDLSIESNLRRLCSGVNHVVILSDAGKEDEESDMDAISKILHLRDIRARYGMKFNITAEMRREHNQRLISVGDNTDYIVASNLSSLFLAQFAENPELIAAFRELLSNEGNELYLRPAAALGCAGEMTTAALRMRALGHGCLFLGWRRAAGDGFETVINPALGASVRLETDDQLIVISEE